MKIFIFCQISPDYKYSRIFDGLDVECKTVTTIQFLKYTFGKKEINKQYVYHIRYLLWKGFLFTLPMYCLIILVCKLRRIPLIFTCHNLIEHRYPSKLYSICVRNLVSWAADEIIVMQEDIKKALVRFSGKTHVACFGDFKPFFRNKHQPNEAFCCQYQTWLKHRTISGPDIMFIGGYSRYNNIEYLVKFLEKHAEINGLIISDGCPTRTLSQNICIFDQKVVAELDWIHQQKGIIGFIAISNFSVSTSVYVYANYNIPIMAANYGPTSSIIKKFRIGEVFESQDDIYNTFIRIKNNYESYQAGIELFKHENNWEVSRKIHQSVLEKL